MSEKVKTFKPIKNLSRDPNGSLSYEPFTANGNKYLFVKPGDEISIKVWLQYQQLSIVAGFGRTFADIVSELQKAQEVLGSDQPLAKSRIEVILRLDSLVKGILDLSRERYEKSLYLVSLFVYREGENPDDWSMAIAERNIQDWIEENMSLDDFFLYCSNLIKGFRETYRELWAREENTRVELSGATS